MKAIAATMLLLSALGLGILEFIALIDPSGTKMSDDADPFGAPIPWSAHALSITFIILLVFSAFALLRHSKHQKLNPPTKANMDSDR